MKIKNILFGTFFSLILGLGIIACNDTYRIDVEESQGIEGYSNESENVLLKFDLEGLKFGTPSTRALSKEGENEIDVNKVRMLVFGQDNNFSYEAKITSIKPTNTDKSKGSLTLLAKNTPAGVTNTFVLLTNVQPSSNTDVSAFAGKSKEEVLKLFTFNITANSTWADGQLPMWGTLECNVNHNSEPVPNLGTIHLIRAVARIDVGLNISKGQGETLFNETADGISGITMTSVKFYNMNDKGTVAPASGNLESGSTTKVTAPTMPDDVKALKQPVVMGETEIKNGNLLQRSVYVPEALNKNPKATQSGTETHSEEDQENYLNRPYMVVGLKGADKSNKENTTYFRIDFLKKTGDEATATYEYLPLLRNYRYLVNITNVGGPGFDNEEDAKKGPAANIMYNVVVWNESDMTNVKYDGQYMLGVSEDHFTFYREGGSLTAKVKTSWPEGFEVKNLPTWINYTVAPAKEGANGKTDEKIVTFIVKEHVTEDRTYPMDPADAENALKAAYVQAGRMKWFLHFEQKKELNLDIKIYEDEACTILLGFISLNQLGAAYNPYEPSKCILGGDGQPLSAEEARASVTFYVKTEPGNLAPTFNEDVTGHFSVESQGEVGENTGIWKYKVTAKDITENDNYFESYTNAYFFKITHAGTNKTVKAKLVVLQKEYNAIPFADEALSLDMLMHEDNAVFIMNGIEQDFYVQANADYKLEMISSEPEGEELIQGGFMTINESNPSLDGNRVPFTPVNDMIQSKVYSGKMLMRISSPLGLFPTREFYLFFKSAIIQPEANTYMIKAGAKQGILIPVSRVNTARAYYETLLDNDLEYISGGVGTKESKLLPGTKQTYMLNELTDDDNYTIEIIWSDIHLSGEDDPIKKAGINMLARYGKESSKSYVYVEAGKVQGNVLVAIRSNKIMGKPILWSWHIWIVDKYPTTYKILKGELEISTLDGGKKYMPDSVRIMSHNIGAYEEPKVHDDNKNWREHGFQYQWGRKDPFPAANVRLNTFYYDANGSAFDFLSLQRGVKANFGDDDARNAVGASFTMRGSIENPNSIVSHRSAWLFEQFPIGDLDDFKDKYVFNYLWYRYDKDLDLDIADGRQIGRKTVFDPSPYGFRIMDYREGNLVRVAYYHAKVKATKPGWIYDGSYTDGASGKANALYAVSISRKTHWAGYYLINTTGWTHAGNDSYSYRRGNGFSVRPVVDPEHYGAEKLAEKDWKKYLPK